MNILICTTNPFGKIGGGEAFYRQVVLSSPTDHFYFFGDPKATSETPPNVTIVQRTIAPKSIVISLTNNLDIEGSATKKILNESEKSALKLALTIARSVRNLKIDHIHIPEYEIVGPFLKGALKHFGNSSATTSTFIHGGLSQTMKFRENCSQIQIDELLNLENDQRDAADEILAFTSSNLAHLKESQNVRFVDPSLMLKNVKSKSLKSRLPYKNTKPVLILAGRFEPVKGFERVIDLYPYLSEYFSGIEFWNNSNTDQELMAIRKVASQRGIELKIIRPKPNEFFFEKFPRNGLLVIPSLFDSFNLMALDAAAMEIPLVISKNAGASKYFSDLDSNAEKYIFDPSMPSSMLTVIGDAAENFRNTKEFARQLSFSLSRGISSNERLINFEDIKPKVDSSLIQRDVILSRMQLKFWLGQLLPSKAIEMLRVIEKSPNNLVRFPVKTLNKRVSLSIKLLIQDYLRWIRKNHQGCKDLPFIRKVKGQPIIFGRTATFSEIRDIALLEKQFEIALTYQLRLIREQSRWSSSDLNLTLAIAKKASNNKVFEFLDSSLNGEHNSQTKKKVSENNASIEREQLSVRNKLEVKSKVSPSLEIIVSSYMARDKLPSFLSKLYMHKSVRNGQARVIFIDANSPQRDFEYAHSIAESYGMGITSFQMQNRISIQEAWNFGISQSRAPYLVFLGTDESIFPGTFESALIKFNNDENLDWITFSSFVSQVDSEGNFLFDKGNFDRSGFAPGLQYLDSSYVNFVGGVLRKSIFDRYGYFDGTFKGAGDTEFKSRIMKHVKVECSPIMGGQFLDYPEQRTTASVMAEIEDFVAWYSFRRGHALRELNSQSAESLLQIYDHALGYRKSYACHFSTDILLASRVIEIYSGPKLKLTREVLAARDLYLKIFSAKRGQEIYVLLWTIKLSRLLAKLRVKDKSSGMMNVTAIRHDNSLEQHGWIW